MKRTRKVIGSLMFSTMVMVSLPYAEDVGYMKQIKPVFESKCAACHGQDSPEYPAFKEEKKKFEGKMKGPRMDNYTHLIFFVGWPDNGALMRRLDDGKSTKDGKAGNMYQYLGGTEEERQKNLSLFKEWVGNWTLKRWPEITKEDLNGLKLKY